jgi:FMN-dependent NADH-azoreductase
MVVCSCIQASEGVSVAKYVEFWLRFIGVRSITAMTVEHTWDTRAPDMIDEGKKQAAELARQF